MDFELKYKKNKINDDDTLFSITFRLETDNGKISFLVADKIEFAINELGFKICKGGYEYGDTSIEKDIKFFLEKLKKKEFPCEFSYNYECSSEYKIVRNALKDSGYGEFNIEISDEGICINKSHKVPYSETLLKSVINFFEYLYTIRNKFKEEYY